MGNYIMKIGDLGKKNLPRQANAPQGASHHLRFTCLYGRIILLTKWFYDTSN